MFFILTPTAQSLLFDRRQILLNTYCVIYNGQNATYYDNCKHHAALYFITHAPLFRGGADNVYESPWAIHVL